MAKFDDEQLGQLNQLFDRQQQWLEARFVEERTYFRQMIRDEVADIRQQLIRIEQQIGGDAKDALEEIDKLNRRVDELEATVAKLQTA